MFVRGLVISFVLIFFIKETFAQDTIKFYQKDSQIIAGEYFQYYLDQDHRYSIEEVSSPGFEVNFKPSEYPTLDFGFEEASIWLKFDLINLNPEEKQLILEIAYPFLDSLDFYFQARDGKWTKIPTGLLRPQRNRPLIYRHFVFYLDQPYHRSKTYYLRIRNRVSSHLPLIIYAPDRFQALTLTKEIHYGSFMGVMLLMFLSHLFLFFSLKSPRYLYYSLYILFSTLTYTNISGHNFQYIWGDQPHLGNQFYIIFIGLDIIFLAAFSRDFLRISEYFPRLNLLFRFLIFLGFLYIPLSFLVSFPKMVILTLISILLSAFLMMGLGFIIWIKGYPPAKYFFMAWIFQFLGILLIAAKEWMYIPVFFDFAVPHSGEIGFVLEVLFFSLALSNQFRRTNAEKKKAVEKIINLQRDANELLEHRVAQRTKELTQKQVALEEQQKALQFAYSQIRDSVRYARRIQQRILEDPTSLSLMFPQNFIFFQAKDIVSGDFYWFNQIGDNKILIVADCTGHGVPGSFMTIMGIDFLNEIIIEKQIQEPDQILKELDQKIIHHLRQEIRGGEVHDGMDISILIYQEKERSIKFAGAKSPLILIRNQALEVFKGGRFSVGGYYLEQKKAFQTHLMEIKEGDAFYLFTDGYVDQFGQANNRKFMRKRFKELLLRIHQRPIDQQKEAVIAQLKQWKGNKNQTDDILVIGLVF